MGFLWACIMSRPAHGFYVLSPAIILLIWLLRLSPFSCDKTPLVVENDQESRKASGRSRSWCWWIIIVRTRKDRYTTADKHVWWDYHCLVRYPEIPRYPEIYMIYSTGITITCGECKLLYIWTYIHTIEFACICVQPCLERKILYIIIVGITVSVSE